MPYPYPFKILVAEKNPHVRELLRREIESQGYDVAVVGNAREMVSRIHGPAALDLMIMDPDLPDRTSLNISDRLNNRIPPLTLIIHGFSSDFAPQGEYRNVFAWVEKNAGSIEVVKSMVNQAIAQMTITRYGHD